MSKIDMSKLQSYKEDGLIRTQTHPHYHNLLIINYTEKVQFEDLWDDFLLQCRGLVVNTDNGEVLARPFKKFFNIEENKHTPTKDFKVYEKMDGSLGILFKYKGALIFATRGSFTSDQAKEFKKIFFEQVENNKLDPYCLEFGKTYLFEILYPENRIVVDYNGKRDIILLGVMDNIHGLENDIKPYKMFGFNIVPEYHDINDYNKLKHIISDNQEGFVIKFSNGDRCKIKGEEYIRLHRVMTGLSTTSIWSALKNGDNIYKTLEDVPDEIYHKVDMYIKELKIKYLQIENNALHKYIDIYTIITTKKEFALKANQYEISGLLFAIYNKKDYSQIIWKMLKPEYKII